MGELAALGEEILMENVGGGDGAVDGAASADGVDDLLLEGEWDFCHENLIRTTR